MKEAAMAKHAEKVTKSFHLLRTSDPYSTETTIFRAALSSCNNVNIAWQSSFVHKHYDLNNNKAIGTGTKSGGTVSCNFEYITCRIYQ